MTKLDPTDLKILDVLKENSKLSTSQIAKRTLIPTTTVYNRIRKLEKDGIIRKYTVILDQKKLGRPLTAYILIHYNLAALRTKISREQLRKEVLCLPYVEEIKYLTGRYGGLLKVHLKDMEELNNLILNKLIQIPGVGTTETCFVLEDVK